MRMMRRLYEAAAVCPCGAECCKVGLLDSHVQYADSSSGDGSEGMVSTNVWTLANHECRMCTLEAFHEACRRDTLHVQSTTCHVRTCSMVSKTLHEWVPSLYTLLLPLISLLQTPARSGGQ
jgi:hypothetical protein